MTRLATNILHLFTKCLITFCRVLVSFLILAYFSSQFCNGNSFFIDMLEWFFYTYPEGGSSFVPYEYTAYCKDLAEIHKKTLVINYLACLKFIAEGWSTGLFESLSDGDFCYIVCKCVTVIKSVLPLLTFGGWLNFWTDYLYPVMPWSLVYSGNGNYGFAYKWYIRESILSCLKILLGCELGIGERQLVYNFLLCTLYEVMP